MKSSNNTIIVTSQKPLLFLLAICLISSTTYSQDKWEYLPNTGLILSSRRFEDTYFTDYQTGFAVNLSGRIFKTKDGGTTWKSVPPDTITKSKALRSIEFLDDGKTGIIGSLSEKIYRSTDAGESWTDISSSLEDTLPGLYYPKAICGLSHFGDNFYGVGWYSSKTAHFYKSTDKGLHWETHYLDSSLATSLVDIVFTSANTGFVSGTKRKTYPYSEEAVILKTTDGGNTWSTVFSYEVAGGIVWKLQQIDKDNFVGSIQNNISNVQMTKSTDGGNTWTLINTGFENTYTQAIGFVTPQKGWLGGHYLGMYETIDGGLTWNFLNFGNSVNRIFVMDSAHVYAAGEKIYRYGSDFSVGIDNQLSSSPIHKLYPIVPNPSDGKVNISFDLGSRTAAIVQVYNVEAKKIWTVNNSILNPGHYSFEWNDPTAPSGTYVVRIDNNEIVMTEKFVLIKK